MNSDNYPEYYKVYIEKVPEGNPLELLENGVRGTLATLAMVSEEKANESYKEGKWSIKDILQHIIDTERIFCYRALSFARGEKLKIPGYNHNAYANMADANSRSLKELLEELKRLRISTIDLFRSFSKKMLQEEGNANELSFKVEQLQYILIGHELHHRDVIEKKYLT